MLGRANEHGGRRHAGVLARVLASGLVLILNSCLDCREEFWFERNGSGRADIRYGFPATVAALQGGDAGIRKIICGFLNNNPAITSSNYQVNTTDGRTQVQLQLGFDSALDLRDLAASSSMQSLPTAATDLAGKIQTDLQGRTLDFRREISAGKALPGAAFLPSSQCNGLRMVYIMHLPEAAEESNATQVLDGGRTLVWDLPLRQALKAPVVTQFKMKLPIPWKIVGATMSGLLLACVLTIMLRRNSRRRRSKMNELTNADGQPV
jgi:hypothetical protein